MKDYFVVDGLTVVTNREGPRDVICTATDEAGARLTAAALNACMHEREIAYFHEQFREELRL